MSLYEPVISFLEDYGETVDRHIRDGALKPTPLLNREIYFNCTS
jgi:hypothetical protein